MDRKARQVWISEQLPSVVVESDDLFVREQVERQVAHATIPDLADIALRMHGMSIGTQDGRVHRPLNDVGRVHARYPARFGVDDTEFTICQLIHLIDTPVERHGFAAPNRFFGH